MAHLKESFVEDGKTYLFDGDWTESDDGIRVRGTVHRGLIRSRVDLFVELEDLDIESASEAELEDASMTAVIEWVKAKME